MTEPRTDFAAARRAMIDSQLRTFEVVDRRLLGAMDTLPRERFVAKGFEGLAYSDRDLPAGAGEAPQRRALAPALIARLVQALAVQPGEAALDVACGLGYSSALLATLGARVTALEADPAAAQAAQAALAEAGIAGVAVVAAPLESGPESAGTFDAILVNGAVADRPQALLDRLASGGRLACVEGAGRAGRAVLYLRTGNAFGRRALFDAAAPVLPAFSPEPAFTF